jgi:hypothetical protein
MVIYKRKKVILNKLLKYSQYLKAKNHNRQKIKNHIIKYCKNKDTLKLDILSNVSILVKQRCDLITYYNYVLKHRKSNPNCTCKHCLQLYFQTKYRLIEKTELSKGNYYIYNKSDTSYLLCNFINVFNYLIYKNGFNYVDSIINTFDDKYIKKYNLRITCYILENKWLYINDQLFKIDVQNMKNCLINQVFKNKEKIIKDKNCCRYKIYNYLKKNLSEDGYKNIFILD